MVRWFWGALVIFVGLVDTVLSCAGPPGPPVEEGLGAVDLDKARSMCIGSPVRNRSGDQANADAIMAGELVLEPHGSFALPNDPSWLEDPFLDDNWKFQLHTLAWLDILRRVSQDTDNAAMLERYASLLRDWVADHPYLHPLPAERPSWDYAWFDMAVGYRALVLTCALGALGRQNWLLGALRDHGNALADRSQYSGTGNHAMHQNNGLLALGCIGENRHWRDLAASRNETLLPESVDKDGVSLEGSASYQSNNHNWWLEAGRFLDACQLERSQAWDRIEKMPPILAHMTGVDGVRLLLGDSGYGRFSPFAHPTVAWAVTAAVEGRPPADKVVVFERAGHVFGRSGWGTERPMNKESRWSFRFGPPLDATVHGHQDHGSITFGAFGSRLLWDQGLFAYGGDQARAYVVSAAAHNVVEVEGTSYERNIASPMIAQQQGRGFHFFVVDVDARAGARWRRSLFASQTGHYLIVRDTVESPSVSDHVWRWHLGEDRETLLDYRRADTFGPGANLSFVWAADEPQVSVRKGEQAPLLGWRSLAYRELVAVPVIEARLNRKFSEVVTLIMARDSGESPNSRGVTRSVQAGINREITVRRGSQCETIVLGVESASILSPLGPC